VIQFVLRRLLQTIPLLLGIIVVSFLFMRLAPGGPFDEERALDPVVRANLEARYGLDRSLPEQLALYVQGLLRGDLGPSFKYSGWQVREIIAQALPVSLTVGLVALASALLIGIPLGVIGALRHNRWPDYAAMSVAMVGICVPNFVLGPMLIILFVFQLGWLPVGGFGSFEQLLLPGFTLGAIRGAYVARLMRAGMLEVIGQDFVRTARAKGLTERVVVAKHALRLAILPVVSYLGPAIASILVGSVVVEKIFSIPGLGTFFVNSALNRDYTLAMGTVLLYSGLLIALNLLVDVLYSILDPRVELQ
jgi:oligopeptide transport system permease protein